MVPAPHANMKKTPALPLDSKRERIVISGISGIFPKCHHIKDLTDVLYNKVDPVANSNSRWKYDGILPKFHGKVPQLGNFDATFFKVSSHLARVMDPMARKLLEQSYKAIFDAGLSADHIAGRNIGVYIGTTLAEAEKSSIYDIDVSAHTMPGCSKAMFANRISYFLDLKGPSMSLDNACASSIIALQAAYLAIQRGDCEAALVGTSHVALHPQTLIQYSRIVPLSEDCKCKSFDENADGCAKSEAVTVLFLQKAQDALRIYGEIVHVKTEYELVTDAQRLLLRNPDSLADFMEIFYKEANVSPSKVEYVEAFAPGIPYVDKCELEMIEKVFCKDRSNPLLVGSVMSNIGNTEAASGISGLVKVLLGYKKGLLAANLHCLNPRKDVKALCDGRIRLVTEHEPFNSGAYAAVNNFSYTGINGHVLIRGYNKPKVITPKPSIPYLVNISARNEASVKTIIDNLKERPLDNEELALLHNIYKGKNIGNLSRGYVILDTNEENKTVCLSECTAFYDDVKRPLWFVYSGMGSQWAGMGAQLMKIPIFSAAIERCHKALAPKGIDIVHIITSNDKTIFDNILHSFVGIAAIQIGLTDVLREIGIVPDNIIGHSVGELGCGYADGCFTVEEMILSAYSRGLVSLQTEFIRGSMAAVGIGYKQAVKLCPPEIEVACHNGPESCTISGPAEAMREFVSKLTAQGIFAKEVPCSNIAYHSRYIAEAGPKLLEYLSEVIKNPKRRSERWMSSSVPQNRWNEENAQYCSAWYHTNNLLSPVLFEESSRLIPANAVTLEVAPHGLLQAILKRSLHPDCRHIPLTKRGHADNSVYVLEAIGKLFLQGFCPNVDNLYPKVEFPVSTEAPSLSHLVEWNTTDKWYIPLTKPMEKEDTYICNFFISIHDKEYSYFQDHVIRGKTLYPRSAILIAVWDTLAMASGVKKLELPVQFHDVHLYTQPILHDRRHLKLRVSIHQGTGKFEVVDDISKVATGFINEIPSDEVRTEQLWQSNDAAADLSLNSDQIYNLLQERDYSYTGVFRSIYKCNDTFTEAQLIWNDNWVTMIDGMLQQSALQRNHSNVSQPSHIYKLTISLKDHDKMLQVKDKMVIPSYASPVLDTVRCGGILIEKIRYDDIPPVRSNNLKLLNKKDVTDNEFVRSEEKVSVARETTLRSETIGDINSLKWVETPKLKSSDGIGVTVHYAGINVLDANVAMGVFPPKQTGYGMDYSGITDKGERVMGVVREGAASSRVRAEPGLRWPVPAHWTLEDAATVPLAYAQAFYCFGIKAPLHRGMTILVQGAAGALGQAVISIALAYQCKVFATVRDDSKKNFLLRLFPDLTEEHVGSSRDESFADMVLLATKGKGCDLIFCCSSGEIKNATLKCGTFCGITIDTVQAHSKESFHYGMNYMTKQRSYMVVDFYNMFKNDENIKLIQSMMSEGIARGYVRPLSRVVLPATEAARAFHLLTASHHRGRVLLQLPDCGIPAQPSFTCSPDLNQLVVCNEDYLSFQFVDRLIKCGARNILLHSCPLTQWFFYKEKSWQNMSAKVQTIPREKNSVKDLRELLNSKNIEGIFLISSENAEDSSILSNLDAASRNCPSIKYFTILSTKEYPSSEQMCLVRAKNQLPGSIVYLLQNKVKAAKSIAVSQNNVMDVVERALLSEQRVLKIQLHQDNKSVLEKIADITGIKVPINVEDDTTLKQIGFNSSYSPAVLAFLRHSCNISVEVEEIPYLTVKLLRQIERKIREPDFKEKDGMASLFTAIDPDELLAITDVLTLPTLVRHEKVMDHVINRSKQYLWVVPGLEGQGERFRSLCERLKIPALVLHPGVENLNESVQETAQRYLNVLSERTRLHEYNNFYILGYETGIFTALEMAAILETKGMVGTVYCVGGSPDQILSILRNKLKDLNSEDALQNALISQFASLLCTKQPDNLSACFESGLPWNKKLIRVEQIIGSVSRYSCEFVKSFVEAAYDRIKQSLNVKLEPYNLKSNVVLLNANSENDTSIVNTNSLSKLKHVTSYELGVPLEHAAQFARCASIVNDHLDTDLIKTYENQNHCELIEESFRYLFQSKFDPVVEGEDD